MLEMGEDGATAREAGITDAGYFELGLRCQAAHVERFEGGAREEEPAVKEGT